jgi:hypothetical protein
MPREGPRASRISPAGGRGPRARSDREPRGPCAHGARAGAPRPFPGGSGRAGRDARPRPRAHEGRSGPTARLPNGPPTVSTRTNPWKRGITRPLGMGPPDVAYLRQLSGRAESTVPGGRSASVGGRRTRISPPHPATPSSSAPTTGISGARPSIRVRCAAPRLPLTRTISSRQAIRERQSSSASIRVPLPTTYRQRSAERARGSDASRYRLPFPATGRIPEVAKPRSRRAEEYDEVGTSGKIEAEGGEEPGEEGEERHDEGARDSCQSGGESGGWRKK